MDLLDTIIVKDESGLYKPVKDTKSYKKLTLPNGLHVVLIADPDIEDTVEEIDIARRQVPKRRRSSLSALSRSLSDDSYIREELVQEVMQSTRKRRNSIIPENLATRVRRDSMVPDLSDNSTVDAKKKMSAAYMRVNVGSLADPDDIPGLAHLLEHVILMGSEKYPQENALSQFLNVHGGSYNAVTGIDMTSYWISLPHAAFVQALRIFAHCFISPLLTSETIAKEIKAVDSEFNDKRSMDCVRMEQFYTTLMKEGHPLNKFAWGNEQTLRDIPMEKSIDVQQALRDFWSNHYVAPNMVLAVMAQETLDALEMVVHDLFSHIQTGGTVSPYVRNPDVSFDFEDSPYTRERFHRLYVVKPVDELSTLIITWWLPCLLYWYKTQPLMYLGHLVGHEGKGSLLSFLKSKGLASSLIAGDSLWALETNQHQDMFVVSIELTDQGMQDIERVAKYAFLYMDLLRSIGPQEWFIREMLFLDSQRFRFPNDVDALSATSLFASRFFEVPYEDMYTQYLSLVYDPVIIEKCMENLTPDKACFIVVSSIVFQQTDGPEFMEKWTSLKYKEMELSESWLEKLPLDAFEDIVHFPGANQFIPYDFTLKPTSEYDTKYPVVIAKGENYQVWYKKDNIFKQPKAYIALSFSLPTLVADVRKRTAMDLFLDIVHENLSEKTYGCEQASCDFYLSMFENMLVIHVFGFNDKLELLLRLIVDHIVHFKVEVDTFHIVKANLLKNYLNDFRDGSSMESWIRSKLLVQNSITSFDKVKVLPTVQLNDVISVSKEALNKHYLECLFQGNFTAEECMTMVNYVVQKIPGEEVTTKLARPKVHQLPLGETCIRVSSFNFDEKTSVASNYYQVGPCDIKNFLYLEILESAMEEPLFNTLRTEEGLGYTVSCNYVDWYDIGGLEIMVVYQTEDLNPGFVDSRIENFCKEYVEIFKDMNKGEFRKLVKSLIHLKSTPDLTVFHEASRNWDEIVGSHYCFDRVEQQIEILKKMSLEDFKFWILKFVLNFDSYRKLSVQVIGRSGVEPLLGEDLNGVQESTYSLQYLVPTEEEESSAQSFVDDIDRCGSDLALFSLTDA